MPSLPYTLIASLAAYISISVGGQSMADEPPPGGVPRPGVTSFGNATLGRVGVTIDFASVLALAEPARTVIIGNPGIADGTLTDERTIVLTGKVEGTTNLIILGEGGREIMNTVISVSPSRSLTTTVYGGEESRTFSCTGACKPILSVGDEGYHFNRARDQMRDRQNFLSGGAALH
ncbi:pilus assembly protein N-terminal domain-containing protein [Microvirga roseola]|uniref:pilus assembly protein N-terminal domain-containing protein n=1 Tax=Microvirga roseola TaxID=2883126 RepID=UPI00389943F3